MRPDDEPGDLIRPEHVAGQAPVDRHDDVGTDLAKEPVAVPPSRDLLDARRPQRQFPSIRVRGTAFTTSESPTRSRTRPHRIRQASMVSTTVSACSARMSPTLGKTSRTWNAWTGLAPEGALAGSHVHAGFPSRGRKRRRNDSPSRSGVTDSSRGLPSQYASTTRRSSGSAIALARAMSSSCVRFAGAQSPATIGRARGMSSGIRSRSPHRVVRNGQAGRAPSRSTATI